MATVDYALERAPENALSHREPRMELSAPQ